MLLLRPRCTESFQRSSRPPSWFKGPTSTGREGNEGKEKKEKRGGREGVELTGGEGRKGRGRREWGRNRTESYRYFFLPTSSPVLVHLSIISVSESLLFTLRDLRIPTENCAKSSQLLSVQLWLRNRAMLITQLSRSFRSAMQFPVVVVKFIV